MIESIEIARLRGIREGKLEKLTPLTILVGPNGCGKSTVLDALLIAASPKIGDAIGRAVVRRRAQRTGVRWLVWKQWEGEPATVAVSTFRQRRSVDLRVVDPDEAVCKVKYSALRRNLIAAPNEQSGGSTVDFIDGRYTDSGFLFDRLDECREVRLVEPFAFASQEPLSNVYSRAIEQGRREQAIAILRGLLPKLETIQILTEKDKPLVHLVFPDYSVPVAFAGDGVLALTRLCVEMAARPLGVVLVEEPEVHEHIRAITQTAKAIWAAVRRGVQVVISTHSLELIDELLDGIPDAEIEEKLSLFRLHLEDGKLDAARVPGDSVAFARSTIGDDLR